MPDTFDRHCSTCGTPIRFIETAAGKKSPIDAKPRRMWFESASGWRLVPVHESHFVTCPQAAEHRKRDQ